MSKDEKQDELRKAMEDYKMAVLRGLNLDHVDPCWRKAILALPAMFDKRTVETAKRFLEKHK